MAGKRVRMCLDEALSEREGYLRQWLMQFCQALEQSTEYDSPPKVEVEKPAKIKLIPR